MRKVIKTRLGKILIWNYSVEKKKKWLNQDYFWFTQRQCSVCNWQSFKIGEEPCKDW